MTLDDSGVRVEVAAAAHSAIYRMKYPAGRGRLLVDCQHGIGFDLAPSIVSCDARAEGDRRIVGTTRRKGWVDRQYSFVIEFDRAFSECVVLPKGDPREKAPRFALAFDFAGDSPLHAETTSPKATPGSGRGT